MPNLQNIMAGNMPANKVFNNGMLRIHSNTIVTPNGIVQISNISRVFVEKLPQISYLPGILVALAGAGIMTDRYAQPIGIILLIVGAVMLYFAYQKNSANKYGLFLSLNSGDKLIFPSGKLDFLYDAANFLANVFEGKINGAYYSITFTDNSIHDVNGGVVTGGRIERMVNNVEK